MRWIPLAAVICELIAMLATWSVRRPMRPALKVLAIYLTFSVAEDLYMGYLGAVRHQNNLWVSYITSPLNATLILWSFTYWQRTEVAKLALRITAAMYGVLSVLLLLTLETPDSFATYSYPIQSVIVLAVAVHTFVTRARETDQPLPYHDWFWICIGWAVLQTFTLATYTLVNLLDQPSDRVLLLHVFEVRTIAAGVAWLLIAVGASRAWRGIRTPVTSNLGSLL